MPNYFDHLLLLGRIARTHSMQMQPIAPHRVVCMICLCVCVYALQKRLDGSRCRLGRGLVGPKEPCISSDPVGEGAI